MTDTMRRVLAVLFLLSPFLLTTSVSDAGPGRELPWPSAVDWKTWDDGIAQAKKEKKPICLVVYTKWCPRCRELAPMFASNEIAKLSKNFVMIRQDRDQTPAWLQQYAQTGAYIPRVLFLSSTGRLNAEITSGIAKYPYFYTSAQAPQLVASMKRALATK